MEQIRLKSDALSSNSMYACSISGLSGNSHSPSSSAAKEGCGNPLLWRNLVIVETCKETADVSSWGDGLLNAMS